MVAAVDGFVCCDLLASGLPGLAAPATSVDLSDTAYSDSAPMLARVDPTEGRMMYCCDVAAAAAARDGLGLRSLFNGVDEVAVWAVDAADFTGVAATLGVEPSATDAVGRTRGDCAESGLRSGFEDTSVLSVLSDTTVCSARGGGGGRSFVDALSQK